MIVIVGGGAAGLSAAEALRELGHEGEVTLLGSEPVAPYDRPVLSKRFLVDRELDEAPALRTAETLAALGIVVRTGIEVAAIDRDRGVVRTEAGEAIAYDRLLLAPGATPRRLAVPGAELGGIHHLRELGEARALRDALTPGRRLGVVGGGVIGLEVAASAAELGLTVTVVEAAPALMGRIGPPGFAELLRELHEARGVRIRTGASVVGFDGEAGLVTRIRLDGGDGLDVDAAFVGVGATPRTALAAAAGLAVDDGILVDERLCTGDPRIFAAGDATRVLHAELGHHIRIEQWRSAEEQGRHAAASMLGSQEPFRATPWMWSDQHELHMQAAGFGFEGLEVIRHGGLDARGGITFLGLADGRLCAACGVSVGTGVARTVRAAQVLMEAGARIDPSVLADANVDLLRLARELAAQA